MSIQWVSCNASQIWLSYQLFFLLYGKLLSCAKCFGPFRCILVTLTLHRLNKCWVAAHSGSLRRGEASRVLSVPRALAVCRVFGLTCSKWCAVIWDIVHLFSNNWCHIDFTRGFVQSEKILPSVSVDYVHCKSFTFLESMIMLNVYSYLRCVVSNVEAKLLTLLPILTLNARACDFHGPLVVVDLHHV